MFRVISIYSLECGKYVKEYGPWHASREQAEYWAEVLKAQGYKVEIGELKDQIEDHQH